MNVAIYARVSTKQQNPAMQLDQLRQYAADRKMTIVREYVDWGVSGAKESRPQLDQLMDDARKRKFDTVMVWKFDRFARSVRHLVTALEDFHHCGIDFISYSENLDTATPMGKAVFAIIAAMAELERNLIKERVCAGLDRIQSQIQEQGSWITRPDEKGNTHRATRWGRRPTELPEPIPAGMSDYQAVRHFKAMGLKVSRATIQRRRREQKGT